MSTSDSHDGGGVRITEPERCRTSAHAREQLHLLESCPRASAEDLGRARDLANTTHRTTDRDQVATAVELLDRLVADTTAHN